MLYNFGSIFTNIFDFIRFYADSVQYYVYIILQKRIGRKNIYEIDGIVALYIST